jgi:Flp pilus assembly pilin Flp
MGSITRFIHDDNGADLIEYALLVGLVSLAAVSSLGGISEKVVSFFADIKDALDGVEVTTGETGS